MLNFTDTGFKVVKTPPDLFAKIQAYWNQHRDDQSVEWQSVIHSYQNSWEAPTTMIPVQKYDTALRDEIWQSTRDILQEWSGQRLAPSAFWGIRIYHNNSILATHVDVPPRIISAIINVDQDIENEDWPLEVWGHDGVVRNITMKPGDMVLYESHTVIHGRPFPFRGKYFANIFVHFEPLGPAAKELIEYLTEPLGDTPPYLNPSMPEALEEWKRQNPRGWNLNANDVFAAIASGDERAVEDLAIQKPADFWTSARSVDGLTPIDAAIQLDQGTIVKLLIQMKCFSGDVNAVREKAKSVHGEDSAIYKKLKHDEL
jgi:prolyl 4-hydroxylase